MCITGYWHVIDLSAEEVGSLAEPIDDSPSLARIARLAQSYQMAIGVGLIERASDDRLYNTYVVCMPDGQRHIHRKLHAFEHPAIDQGDSFTVFELLISFLFFFGRFVYSSIGAWYHHQDKKASQESSLTVEPSPRE